MNDADFACRIRNYRDAINYYIAIRGYCPELAPSADSAMIKVFTAIERLRYKADRDRILAESRRDSLDLALKEAKESAENLRREKEHSDSLERETQNTWRNYFQLYKQKDSLVKAFFYDDSMALAYKSHKFGFVTKEGNPRIQYLYDKAENFMQIGFARVSRGGKPYLIDRNGAEFLCHGSEIFDTPKFGFDLKLAVDLGAPDTSMFYQFSKDVLEKMGRRVRFQIIFLKSALLSGPLTPTYMREQTLALDLAGEKVGYLSKRIFKLDSLQILLLSGYKLAVVDPPLTRLKKLSYLDLSGNQLTYLPEEFWRLGNLVALDLSYNDKLEQFPDVLFKMPNLRALYLQGTKIAESNELKERLRRNLPNCKVVFD